ncbi:transketolase [Caproiciproducens faecalis]|uniref:Transketolase n=1 Tax=Caproiciproducens faecalis TaxID=2820301 RepID=A0ABS7DN01_9FIRM|nr:transketolase [Caproiciproducens faecalis]MBW7572673.1 transketolase [Caproiciproducens faecalis]
MYSSKQLKKISTKMKILALQGVYEAQSGHLGGSFSASDLVAALFFNHLRIDAKDTHAPDRDRFVLSKGHAAPIYYAALALKGFFDEAEMKNLRKIDSFLQGHPSMNKTPGVDISSGSLGQGLSTANGMALAAGLDNKSYKVYCICGDGEIQEGQIWEAAMTAAHYKLSNVILFVDCNKLQIDGQVEDVMNSYPVADKFRAFGWNVSEIDGHDFDQINAAVELAKKATNKPNAIICSTVKGKGVSFMENQASWHGVAPNKEQYEIALKELESELG